MSMNYFLMIGAGSTALGAAIVAPPLCR